MPVITMESTSVSDVSSFSFRPPQAYLDIFWALSDGDDEQRNAGASKLSQMIQDAKENEKALLLKYCKERLIRGLSSGRKFARVGFSVALTQLLRIHKGLSTSEILETINDKLRFTGQDKKSKAEIGGIYLGKAFAFSSLIQSGRLSQLSSEELGAVIEELLTMAQKKSYLKPVCNKTIEDLVQQVSVNTFGESVWPKIRESMKQGWDTCTLDKLSLLLVCQEKFPDVVNKKFLKRHWGYPVLAEENDSKLLRVILTLLKADNVVPLKPWEEQLTEEWDKMYQVITKIQQRSQGESSKDSAFLLLLLFLAFNMFDDPKPASDLLQEVYVCYEKSNKKKQGKDSTGDAELPWQEVVTEVLLNLMSLQSHLGRVMACAALSSIAPHITVNAVQLITEVLIPKAGRGDDAGGVLVEVEDNEEDDEKDTDDDSLVDKDTPEEESDDDEEEELNDGVDSEEDEDEEEMQIDEAFRASVKEALGAAAVTENDDEEDADDAGEDLSDLSDTEMFKLDDMLAEVFRQRKKAGKGKKSREEKKKEMSNFRIRALDLLEVVIKSERCGDFVPELLRPLLMLILKTDGQDNQALKDKSKSLFRVLRSKTKGLTDNVHTADEQREYLQELMDLAHAVTETSQVQEISLACHLVMSLNCGQAKDSGKQCMKLVEDTIRNVITKGKSKPPLSFFSSLIETDVARYQFICPMLVSCLKDPSVKVHGKMICFSLLSNVIKRTQKTQGVEEDKATTWMLEVAEIVSESIKNLSADDLKFLYTKEVLHLATVLQNKPVVFGQLPFGQEEMRHLSGLKSKLNTDLRRLTNRFIAGIERSHKKCKGQGEKKRSKRERQENGIKKIQVSAEEQSAESTTGRKKKRRKLREEGSPETKEVSGAKKAKSKP